jgi:hypothetical protein
MAAMSAKGGWQRHAGHLDRRPAKCMRWAAQLAPKKVERELRDGQQAEDPKQSQPD